MARSSRQTVVLVVVATCLTSLASAYVQYPLGTSNSLIYAPKVGRTIAATTSLSNGLTALIRAPTAERAAALGVPVPDDWATDPHRIRLLADAVEAYIYLYTPAIVTALARNWPLAPSILHSQALASPAGRGTAPNWDTVYSLSRAELSLGPYVLRFPPLKDRFYSLVLYDAYQNVVVSLGSPQHITDGGQLLLVGPTSPRDQLSAFKLYQNSLGPKSAGQVPYTEIVEFPTDLAVLLIRVLLKNQTAVPDAADIAAVQAFQAGVSLTPYKWTPPVNASGLFPRYPGGVNAAQLVTADPAFWYGWANAAINQYPAPPTTLSAPISSKLKRLGLLDPAFNFSALPPDAQTALTWAVPIGNRLLDAGTLYGFEYEWPSWQVTTRGWGVYGSDFFTNAVVAKSYIIPNTGVDAVYAVAFWDAAGNPLDGSLAYTWTIPGGQLPYDTTLGWWSLIAYDSNATLVENPIQRYGVGDRTKGLQYGANGDLTLYLQADAPTGGPTQVANWLPTPRGGFFVVLRLYSPTQDFIDGKLALQPVLQRQPAATPAPAPVPAPKPTPKPSPSPSPKAKPSPLPSPSPSRSPKPTSGGGGSWP